MKETVNVNIGGVAFTIDDDACRALKTYLTKIEQRLPSEDKESLADIESRIAELLCEKISSPQRVVSLDQIKEVTQRVGDPETFGPAPDTEQEDANEQSFVGGERRLYRSRTNRSIAGVCGGLAQYLKVDTTLVRLATFIFIFFGALSIWIYILMWIIIPEEPIETHRKN